MNEGLEKLGAREIINGHEHEGAVFECTAIENIRIPSTLKRLEAETFSWCENLKSVVIQDGTECIGEMCFYFSEIEEITLPSTLREIGRNAFTDCRQLKTVWVEEGCALDVRWRVGDGAEVKYK